VSGQGDSVLHTRWMNYGKARAHCRNCRFEKRGEKQATVVAAATRHARDTGHEVEVERQQWKLTTGREEAE
jgi:predicted small metal-binding protein